MKMLAFTDLHGDVKRLFCLERLISSKKPDILICAGDLSWFGKHLNLIAKKLDSFNLPILIIPGNHETEENIELISKKFKNIININKKLYNHNNFQFLGLGSGGFGQVNKEFEKQFEKIKSNIKNPKKFIFISHAPPYNTKIDKVKNSHVGSISIRKFIEFASPVLAISGHIHETEHLEDKIKSTRVLNPGDAEFIIL